jgi:hypothetical protein
MTPLTRTTRLADRAESAGWTTRRRGSRSRKVLVDGGLFGDDPPGVRCAVLH